MTNVTISSFLMSRGLEAESSLPGVAQDPSDIKAMTHLPPPNLLLQSLHTHHVPDASSIVTSPHDSPGEKKMLSAFY